MLFFLTFITIPIVLSPMLALFFIDSWMKDYKARNYKRLQNVDAELLCVLLGLNKKDTI